MIDDSPINKNLGFYRVFLNIRIPKPYRNIYPFALYFQREKNYLLTPSILSSSVLELFWIEPQSFF